MHGCSDGGLLWDWLVVWEEGVDFVVSEVLVIEAPEWVGLVVLWKNWLLDPVFLVKVDSGHSGDGGEESKEFHF